MYSIIFMYEYDRIKKYSVITSASRSRAVSTLCGVLQVARLRCALARYLMWEVNASKDFRYQIRPSSSMVHQPCLQQLAVMLKQAGLDHIATTDDRAALLDAIANYSRTSGRQPLSLQVS